MFHLGRQTESALMALKALHGQSGLSVAEISTQHGLSKNTLSKVLQQLQAGGLVTSTQGKKGGYKLSFPLKAVSLYKLLEALGEIKNVTCKAAPCDLSPTCSIQIPILRWEAKFKDLLGKTLLNELIEEELKA